MTSSDFHQRVLMKRKAVKNEVKAGEYYVADFTRGFFGEQNEGRIMLEKMGLAPDAIPFSAARFLQNKKIQWQDSSGKTARMSYKVKPYILECNGSYLGQKKTIRLYLEWGSNEDAETIKKLESEAIGELCMKCIYDKLE